MNNSKMIIPSHIQIETINGVCTSRCLMCPIYLPEIRRKPNVMTIKKYIEVLNKFIPYQKNIKFISLTGHGETLLDKTICEKVKLTKDMGFKGIGFPTNCTELNEDMSFNLIISGLDTIICSIDGFTKETHESIRVGTNYENIINNVKKFIEIRNYLNKFVSDKYKTKILVRFIYQNSNKDEWNDYYNYWIAHLNKNFGDDVIKLNLHNCGGTINNKSNLVNEKEKQKLICKDIFERIIIFSDGDMIFCCGDNSKSFDTGNIFNNDPIKIYNNDTFKHYRKLMKEGRIKELKICKDCTTIREL